MAVAIDFVAVKWWYSYLLHGSVYDGKHGLTFFGEASYGHLAGITLMAAVLSYLFVKSLIKYNLER